MDLVRSLSPDRYEVKIILLSRIGEFLDQLPRDVEVIDARRQSRYSFFTLIVRLAVILARDRPDSVMGVMTTANLLVILASFLSGFSGRVILNEQWAPYTAALVSGGWYGRITRCLMTALYRLSDAVIVSSKGVGSELCCHYGVPANKIHVIYNPIDIGRITALSKEFPFEVSPNSPVIVSCGRLVRQKDFPTLLRAFRELRATIPCQLVIVGDGPERKNLERLVCEMGIQNYVQFTGFKSNPYPYIARGDLFVLASSYEGFGVVIAEAMALGTPVVATRCPAGPEEILLGGECGLLVEVGNVPSLADAMLKLIRDPSLRDSLIAKARLRAKDFEIENASRAYAEHF